MQSLILASTSTTRIGLLRSAGVTFEPLDPGVDERRIETPLIGKGAPPSLIAEKLAEAKALAISPKHSDALVIGADQVLDLDGERFIKPAGRADAADQLRHLSGRTHHLRTAVVIARDGQILWRHQAAPSLTMLSLSDAAIEHYLDLAGDAIFWSVGGYLIEGVGIQLFSAIEGDYFSILGLPLLALLGELRRQGALSME